VSNYERNQLLSRFADQGAKVQVIPNGLNLEEFKGIEKEKNSEKRSKSVLCVTRLEKYKGVDRVLESFQKLDDSFQLEIVGKGQQKQELVGLAHKLGLAGRALFSQDLPREELIRKYMKADVFILLSRYEAYGITVAEALAAGTPCIVASGSALTEWIDDQTCFGVDGTDASAVADMIRKVSNLQIRRRESLDWDKIAELVTHVYEEQMAKKLA
jgi:glycosyltransferase involved in cell wall biosynthesis